MSWSEGKLDSSHDASALESEDGGHGGHGTGKVELGQMRDILMPGVRRLILLLWYIWFVGGGIYYGVILGTYSSSDK